MKGLSAYWIEYNERCQILEAQGMTRSDAQAVVDAEDMRALTALQVAAESLSQPQSIRYEEK